MKYAILVFSFLWFACFANALPPITLEELKKTPKENEVDPYGLCLCKIKRNGRVEYYIYRSRNRKRGVSQVLQRGTFLSGVYFSDYKVVNELTKGRYLRYAGKEILTVDIDGCELYEPNSYLEITEVQPYQRESRFSIASPELIEKGCGKHPFFLCIIRGEIPEKSFEARMRAVGVFTHYTREWDAVTALQSFLEKPPSSDSLSAKQFAQLKKRVLLATFYKADAIPAEFIKYYIEMFSNPALGVEWQIENLQLWDMLWTKVTGTESRKLIASTLKEAAKSTRPLFSIKALQVLSRMAGNTKKMEIVNKWVGENEVAVEVPRFALTHDELGKLAINLAKAQSIPVQERTVAMTIAADAGEASTVLLAREWAPDDAQPTPLREAAISALGKHGNKTDLPLLQSLLQSESPALRAAVQAALKQNSFK
ncbi:MAG: hypothetical protein LBT53_08330 [Puniceicoccales bacterium]|jgi:hypothetical protein|nr:hypothetical protein [Puniceicoccales bacterium]